MSEINILNGESLKQYLKEKYNFHGNYIMSFNECLVDGDVHKDIFDSEFFDIREKFISENYNVSKEQYRENSITELKALLGGDFKKVVLWFDYDMFCQINMLTILAYLEYTEFDGDVEVNIINQDFHKYNSIEGMIIDKIQLNSLENYYNLYLDVLINKNFFIVNDRKYINNFKDISYLKQGVELYSEYKTSNREIKEFINSRLEMDKHSLVIELLKNFRNYGLGDSQFIRIINEVKNV